MRALRFTLHVYLSISISCMATNAVADMYKCTLDGKVTYQAIPCSQGEEKAIDDRTRNIYQREHAARLELDKREKEALKQRELNGGGDESGRKEQAKQAMQEYFSKILIDPSSVQFRNIKVFLDVPGSKLRSSGSETTPLVDVVCGEVNSKNRMGGYVGFKHFYWDSDKREVVGVSSINGELGDMLEKVAYLTCSKLE